MPVYPLIIYLVPFCRSIILNENIHGFRLHFAEVKLLAYADGVVTFWSSKLGISRNVSRVKNLYGATGVSVVWQKCVGFRQSLGALEKEQCENIKLLITSTLYLSGTLQHYKTRVLSTRGGWRNSGSDTQGGALPHFPRSTVCNVSLIGKISYVH